MTEQAVAGHEKTIEDELYRLAASELYRAVRHELQPLKEQECSNIRDLEELEKMTSDCFHKNSARLLADWNCLVGKAKIHLQDFRRNRSLLAGGLRTNFQVDHFDSRRERHPGKSCRL